ncbi:MAG: glycoside hydrolase family 88 protein [Lachnospiraceae bacterium]|nr:glycoside hydrolase family 88 protein [Lachnospiraceae bacterium]
MEIVEKYVNGLIDRSTLEEPVWNIEKIRAGKKATWDYIDGCMIMSLLELDKVTENKKYFEFAEKYIGYRIEEDGTIRGYHKDELNIDNINEGKNLFTLYDLTGKEKYAKATSKIYEQILEMPRTAEGNFWHKQIYPNQVWLDGLYMAQPYYMEYEKRFNDKKNYEDIYQQFFNVEKNQKDAKTGLYYHAYDCSREAFWCDKETGCSKNFWLRALGWFSMALLDTLNLADKGTENYEHLSKMYKDLIDSMLKFQSPEGMWYQVPNFPEREQNYLETSGSAIMSYCLLKGARLGLLPENYREYGVKAFNGICDKYLSEVDGNMSLGGICLVAGLGPEDNTRRDGTYEYYMSEPIVKDDAKGTAPFLLAYAEMLRLEK